MRSKLNNPELHPESKTSREKAGITGSSVPWNQDLATTETDAAENGGQDIAFTIVDDKKNESVYKGPGSYAASRAENAIRAVEKAFPPLRFTLRFEKLLTALHVEARVPPSVENAAFLAALSNALAATGTRLAPIVGELRKDALATPDRRV